MGGSFIGFDSQFAVDLVHKFDNDEGKVEDFFSVPFEYSGSDADIKMKRKGSKNKEKSSLYEFEVKNELVNRFKVNCTFLSITEAFTEYLTVDCKFY